jgi:hypothetical protein
MAAKNNLTKLLLATKKAPTAPVSAKPASEPKFKKASPIASKTTENIVKDPRSLVNVRPC